MDFFNDAGKMALGSRVRFMAEKIGAEASGIYQTYETNLNPKWFPVFYYLSQKQEKTVTSIASYIGHSHASVSKIIREMSRAGLVSEKTDAKDRRRTMILLSKKGHDVAKKIEAQYQDVNSAINEMTEQATHNLWAALEEWEYLLEQKSLKDRVLGKKKLRESQDVRIEDYRSKHKKAFRELNEEWIKTHFKMEQPDRDALGNPQKYVLDGGGCILVATVNKKVIGVCALLKQADVNGFELAKMAVAPEMRGRNIGYLLGQAVIERARTLGADHLFLESNTVLKPAINLYKKLGFKKIVGPPTPYERCNIQMELKF